MVVAVTVDHHSSSVFRILRVALCTGVDVSCLWGAVALSSYFVVFGIVL